jgi:hypothetical protein
MKYKVGDKVKLKSKEGLDELKQQHENLYIPPVLYEKAGSVCTIRSIYDGFYSFEEMPTFWAEPLIEGLAEEENKDMGEELRKCKSDFKYWVDNYIILPDGYVFKDENGNLIYANKIILEKKKKEYPKTYDDCCKVLNIAVRDLDILDNMLDTTEIIYNKNLDRLLNSFRKLLICRDAYWKLYGEEMGLGKPWEPDYDSGVDKFGIICLDGVVQESNPTTNWERHLNKILDFPTRKMRDAFKENFKELIEQCKELL